MASDRRSGFLSDRFAADALTSGPFS
jgi:hypothetical protein